MQTSRVRRAGVAKEDLAYRYFFQAVVLPVLEYACPAWHTSLTQEQSKSLENVQRRALQIIVGNIPYEEACRLFDLPTLAERRFSLCRPSTLLRQITSESYVLHYLWPVKHNAKLVSRLRSTMKYPTARALTNRFKNRIHFRTSSATCKLDCENVYLMYMPSFLLYACMYVCVVIQLTNPMNHHHHHTLKDIKTTS